jgi:hypothetical protein
MHAAVRPVYAGCVRGVYAVIPRPRLLHLLGVTAAPDPTASEDVRAALTAADLGDDAAILGLYTLAGLIRADVAVTPDELFGSQKTRLLTALKKTTPTAAHYPSGGALDPETVA